MSNGGGGNWIVAIDMGGTSTKAKLYSRRREMVAETDAPSFNLRTTSKSQFMPLVKRAVRDLFGMAHLVGQFPGAVVVGVAGAGRPQEREMLLDVLRDQYDHSVCLLHHDAYIAHYGAFEGQPGVMVTAGTGSIAFGKNKDGEVGRAGGWGWLLGDEGSGWWIGHQAVRAALAAWEGSGPETRIEALVCETFELESTYDIIPYVYGDKFNRNRISELAEQVNELALEEDNIACKIMHKAGTQLGVLAASAGKRLNIRKKDFLVALLGSIGTKSCDNLFNGVRQVISAYEGPDDYIEEPEPEHSAKSVTNTVNDPRLIRMPEYPPRDLTLKRETMEGPRLVQPAFDALEGAALWGIHEMDSRMFA